MSEAAQGTWISFADHFAALDRRTNVVHAAARRACIDAIKAKRRTVPTVCGRGRWNYPYAVTSVSSEGCSVGAVILAWPPRVRGLSHGLTRCADCFLATGKPRPNRMWDDVTPAEGDPPKPCKEAAE